MATVAHFLRQIKTCWIGTAFLGGTTRDDIDVLVWCSRVFSEHRPLREMEEVQAGRARWRFDLAAERLMRRPATTCKHLSLARISEPCRSHSEGTTWREGWVCTDSGPSW